MRAGGSSSGAKVCLWAAISQITCLHQCSNVIKKGEYKNYKSVKTKWFLTILFALLLCFNQLKLAEVAMGQKYVCELRCNHNSSVLPQNSNLIKKGV